MPIDRTLAVQGERLDAGAKRIRHGAVDMVLPTRYKYPCLAYRRHVFNPIARVVDTEGVVAQAARHGICPLAPV